MLSIDKRAWFFSNVQVNTRVGSAPEKIIIEVMLDEKPTGSLGIGAGLILLTDQYLHLILMNEIS